MITHRWSDGKLGQTKHCIKCGARKIEVVANSKVWSLYWSPAGNPTGHQRPDCRVDHPLEDQIRSYCARELRNA